MSFKRVGDEFSWLCCKATGLFVCTAGSAPGFLMRWLRRAWGILPNVLRKGRLPASARVPWLTISSCTATTRCVLCVPFPFQLVTYDGIPSESRVLCLVSPDRLVCS
jgi:hypothetical protein